jgi:hypothetical protein
MYSHYHVFILAGRLTSRMNLPSTSQTMTDLSMVGRCGGRNG